MQMGWSVMKDNYVSGRVFSVRENSMGRLCGFPEAFSVAALCSLVW